MPVESIKLSPKKNGKGYVSSYSVSISSREAQECSLIGKPVIKIIDSNSGEIIIKAKGFTVSLEMLRKIVELKELAKEEYERISRKYHANPKVQTMAEVLNQFLDEQTGKIQYPAYERLEAYVLSLSMENVIDLALMMYLGRDMDCDMNTQPGEDRFLEFYNRYNGIVCGRSKEELVDMVLEKSPLLMYLRNGYRLLMAPVGTSLDSFFHHWDEM